MCFQVAVEAAARSRHFHFVFPTRSLCCCCFCDCSGPDAICSRHDGSDGEIGFGLATQVHLRISQETDESCFVCIMSKGLASANVAPKRHFATTNDSVTRRNAKYLRPCPFSITTIWQNKIAQFQVYSNEFGSQQDVPCCTLMSRLLGK